jgi:transposase
VGERGQHTKRPRVTPHLGVDEKAIAKGHQSLTLVCDVDRSTVEYIAEDRKQARLEGYFTRLAADQVAGIEAIALDMWEPYVQAIRAQVPDAAAKMVFDRYHIMTHMGQAVDTVRKREHRALAAAGDDTLSGSKYLWLYAAENLPEQHRERFAQLKALTLKTGRAWALKEGLRELWHYTRAGWAERHWKRWYFWATHSRLAPVIETARMLQRHLPNGMTFFAHRLTNAVTEGLNSKIQTIKKMAYGFRNREHFKTVIYFHRGGLDLYPATHAIPG